MDLSVEEREILKGEKGWTWQKILKTIVLFGETFNVEKLVPIEGAPHFVSSTHSLEKSQHQPKRCIIGCPQLSLERVYACPAISWKP